VDILFFNLLNDDQANAWPFCYYSKTGFLILDCQISTDLDEILHTHTHTHTHLLLYGIHLWADLDRDRRVGDSS